MTTYHSKREFEERIIFIQTDDSLVLWCGDIWFGINQCVNYTLKEAENLSKRERVCLSGGLPSDTALPRGAYGASSKSYTETSYGHLKKFTYRPGL